MLIMRSVLALDKKTIGLRSIASNINEIPAWIEGSSLPLSMWNIELTTPTDIVSIADVEYPIQLHHEFAESTTITTVKLYRSVGVEEFYINLSPDVISGDVFDMTIEFMEQNDS